MRRVMAILGMFVLVGALGVLAQPASAQSDPYVSGSTVVQTVDPPSATVAPNNVAQVQSATQSQGQLPVTGTDVAGLVGLAMILIVVGGAVLIVRRRLEPTQA